MAESVQTPQAARIHPETRVGTVSLTVSDLAHSRAFYERTLGLHSFEVANGAVALAVRPEQPLIELFGDTSAPKLDRRATGLYHLAIVVPTRQDLGFALARIARSRWPLDGASDHLVSEALYLSDPDGNGIEIYRDRPREQWVRSGDSPQMATLPLDLDDLLNEIRKAPEFQPNAPPATTMGHVHLQVADLRAAEAFYHGILGFDVTVRAYPGALFLSAGGYHHHIGLNTWHSAGASPPVPGSIGLRRFALPLPSPAELDRALERVRSAGVEVEPSEDGSLIRDPSGIAVVLRAD